MTPDDILAIPPRVLSQKQRESYFEVNGTVLLPQLFSIDGFDPYLWSVDPLQNLAHLAGVAPA